MDHTPSPNVLFGGGFIFLDAAIIYFWKQERVGKERHQGSKEQKNADGNDGTRGWAMDEIGR